jgi:hypothetical protein
MPSARDRRSSGRRCVDEDGVAVVERVREARTLVLEICDARRRPPDTHDHGTAKQRLQRRTGLLQALCKLFMSDENVRVLESATARSAASGRWAAWSPRTRYVDEASLTVGP